MDQLPRLGKIELICLLLFTCNYVVSAWRGFVFLCVLRMGYVILLWHSLSLPYNYYVVKVVLTVKPENFLVLACGQPVQEGYEYGALDPDATCGSNVSVNKCANGFVDKPDKTSLSCQANGSWETPTGCERTGMNIQF